ncbi:hypothetical protein KDJ21_013855 [Metabacillus litoralis]|uniref:hypothetical protein n=1 Tax=Metabacillus litoralis TaxID=152268 RepID=UPI001B9E6208|nr:hypothetical protein [Metabacillus litoralis]MCM3161667.1 hypothetical protein [Metabacillus litoralis]UHA57967.1 hypothetical protein KDJ21_013855 [Metabacillus litoralis]
MKPRMICTVLFLFIMVLSPAHTIGNESVKYGAQEALEDSNISLAEALSYALEDKYLKQANFDYSIEKYGSIRPFVQIKIEDQHQMSMLLPLFKKYNIELPKDRARHYIKKDTGSLYQVFQIQIGRERNAIKMYKKFLSIREFPKDILDTFQEQLIVSQKHLESLEQNVIKYK